MENSRTHPATLRMSVLRHRDGLGKTLYSDDSDADSGVLRCTPKNYPLPQLPQLPLVAPATATTAGSAPSKPRRFRKRFGMFLAVSTWHNLTQGIPVVHLCTMEIFNGRSTLVRDRRSPGDPKIWHCEIVKVYVIHGISIVFVALQHVCPLSGTSIEVSARDVMPSRSAAHCEDPP